MLFQHTQVVGAPESNKLIFLREHRDNVQLNNQRVLFALLVILLQYFNQRKLCKIIAPRYS